MVSGSFLCDHRKEYSLQASDQMIDNLCDFDVCKLVLDVVLTVILIRASTEFERFR